MAKLHKRSVQEALNSTVGGEWSVLGAETAGSSANVNNSIHVTLGAATATIGVSIHFNFTATATDVHALNDMIIPKDTMMFLTVPRGLGNTVVFNYNSTTTTTGAVRIVEI